MTSIQCAWTTVEGYRIYARFIKHTQPKHTPAIILIHGLTMSSRYMIPTVSELGSEYNIYAIDLPGFGKSSKPEHTLSISNLADVLALWIDTMKFKQVILLGNSFGCQIIIEFSRRYAHLLSHAILVGPTMDPQAPTLFQQYILLLSDMPFEPMSSLLILMRELAAVGLRRTYHTAQHAINQPVEDQLADLTAPTLVVRGERDPIVSQKWVEEIVSILPNARLSVIPKAGHAVNYNSPRLLKEEVKRFLENG